MKNKNFQYLGACFINYQNLPARKKKQTRQVITISRRGFSRERCQDDIAMSMACFRSNPSEGLGTMSKNKIKRPLRITGA